MDPAMAIEVAAMSRQRALEEAIQKGDSEIQRFYCNTTVLITGGSGFMGKQIIEKLFRSCELKKVYVLMRSKKGKAIHERVTEMLKDPVFEPVRKMQPDFAEKLVPIEGDVAEIRLGISHQDWEMLIDEVDVIYHMAATTRLDEALRVATMINVRGTREAMILARACTKLKSFVHVSTAYTQAVPSLVDQEVYEEFKPSPIPPETLISMAESLEESRFLAVSASLTKDWPNTYTFAKAVAEEIVRSMSDGLPICIVRPGAVIAAYREPSPGWLDVSCAYGASGVLLGMSLGVVHVLFQNYYTKAGFIPCDYINNAIIAAGREASRSTGGDNTKIYTVSAVARNTILLGFVRKLINKNLKNIDTTKAVYYVYNLETSNRILFLFYTWFIHLIPAYIVDLVCLLLRKEQRFVKIYQKVFKMTNALSYFSLNTWIFDDKNTESLYKSLSKTDKTIFNFDIPDIDWQEYIKVCCIGVRKYIIKDGLKDTRKAHKKQQFFRVLHYIITALYLYCIRKGFSGVYYIISYLFSLRRKMLHANLNKFIFQGA